MIAVLTGDIVGSTQQDKSLWLPALKSSLANWGKEGKDWEVYRGDEFQLRLDAPEVSLLAAFRIKAHLKAQAETDIRIAIGIGQIAPADQLLTETSGSSSSDPTTAKSIAGAKLHSMPLTESNGPAFILSGRKLDEIKKQRIHLAVATTLPSWDQQWNLLLQWVLVSADNWSSVSAEIVDLALAQPKRSQIEMAARLNVQQSAVSQRMKRSEFDLLWQTLELFKEKTQMLCSS